MEEEKIEQAIRASELIIKYLKEDLTSEEEKELENWVEQNHANRELFSDLTNPERLDIGLNEFIAIAERKRAAHERVIKELFPPKGVGVWMIGWMRYVAAALLILLIGSVIYFSTGGLQQSSPHRITEKEPPLILPGTKKALLQIDGRGLVELTRDVDSTFTAAGTRITNRSGQLVYDVDPSSGAVEYHTIVVPRGGEYELMLTDGTRVWLNAASTLRYPSRFSSGNRKVTLTGEGYFQVASNKRQPFIVEVGDMLVNVTGTEFNINAYEDEARVTSTLFDGKVSISLGIDALTLLPGEQLTLDRGTNKFNLVRDADLDAAVAWKEGLFKLTSADIPTIMRQVSRWYDIEVGFETGVAPKGHISGTIPRNLNLSGILKVLEESGVRSRFDANNKLIILP